MASHGRYMPCSDAGVVLAEIRVFCRCNGTFYVPRFNHPTECPTCHRVYRLSVECSYDD